jgi:hypothetical protein
MSKVVMGEDSNPILTDTSSKTSGSKTKFCILSENLLIKINSDEKKINARVNSL